MNNKKFFFKVDNNYRPSFDWIRNLDSNDIEYYTLEDIADKLNINYHAFLEAHKNKDCNTVEIETLVKQKLINIPIICSEILYLYGGDKEKSYKWLLSQNDLFFNYSPFQMVLLGKGKSVTEKLQEMSGSKLK